MTTSTLPEWKRIFDNLRNTSYGTTISYDSIDSYLINGSVKNSKRYVFEKFRKELLRQENKALENLPNKGYRIVMPNEHVRLTNIEIKKAERRARMACDIILHTDMDKLTEKEKMIAITAASRVQPILATLISEQKNIKEVQKFKLPEVPRN